MRYLARSHAIFRVWQGRKSSRTISLGATWARGSLGCQGDTVNAMKIGENRTPGDACACACRALGRRAAVGLLQWRRLRHRTERAIAVALLFAVAGLGSPASAQTVTSAAISNVLAGGAVTAIARQSDS